VVGGEVGQRLRLGLSAETAEQQQQQQCIFYGITYIFLPYRPSNYIQLQQNTFQQAK
jgi:hypothetical protein